MWCIEHICTQDHTCFLVWRGDSVKTESCQSCCACHSVHSTHEGKTHTQVMGQGRAERWRHPWEPRLSTFFENSYLTISQDQRQVFSQSRFIPNAGGREREGAVLVYAAEANSNKHTCECFIICPFCFHPPSLFPPSFQWWGILRRLPQRSVSSLWAMFLRLEALVKAPSVDWKTIQFSLAGPAVRCGRGSVRYAAAGWCQSLMAHC